MPKTSEELYEEAERQLIGEAIAETEQEIADYGLDRVPDDNDADTSLEEMDGEDVLDQDELGEDAESEESEEGDDAEGQEGEGGETRHSPEDDQPRQVARGGVPPGRLREEAERARAAEAEREAARAEARELRARLDALERTQRQPAQQPERPQEPDMFADPEGWAAHQRAQITQQFEERRINASFAEAEETHGDKFRTAFTDLQRTGNPALVRAIVASHNPGKTLMRWHDQQALLADIGNDPVAFREKVRQELLSDPEVRRAVINGARTDAIRGDGGRARTQVRLPPSLNSATGGTSHRGTGMNGRDTARTNRSTEQEIFDSAFED